MRIHSVIGCAGPVMTVVLVNWIIRYYESERSEKPLLFVDGRLLSGKIAVIVPP